MKIVADSSVMFDIEQGRARGIEILPLAVSIGGETWAEYEQISAAEFLARVREGALPQSSSPSPSATLSAYDTEEEIVHLAMADGLSGAYEVAHGLVKQAKHPKRVQVVNSKTLCVPHRALALSAVELAKQCKSAKEVVECLMPMIESAHSYLIPEDFDYLRRGGRLTPLAAKFAHLLKVVPVMMQTDDGTRLERLTVARSFRKAMDAIAADLTKREITDAYYLGISHADNLEQAQMAQRILLEAFPGCKSGIFELGPAFITQGGPECIAVQVIDLSSSPEISLCNA
ncbi:DegV family protein [Raoultibacter phocaeensis]|uniref:DegV family protein n=1 Tax=Raoultibacter phocaeensis TaxID=2479841 RepID=UPI00111AF1B8|nr:DegV family protein [Raoultibacter phocaeensis]